MDAKTFIKGLSTSTSKKGCKKAGRNKVKCAYYRTSRSRKNKLRKLNNHLVKHDNDACAREALERVQ
jgi:hypothetical protein